MIRRALLVAAFATVTSVAWAQDPDLRDLIRAQPRLAIHEGARVGDWLERSTSSRGLTTRQREAIVGEREGGWVVELTGPAWQGYVLQLLVDKKTGKVVEAKAAPPGKPDDWKGVNLADEGDRPAEKEEGEEDIVVPAGAFHCRRTLTEITGMAKSKTFRFLAMDGPLRTEVVKEVVQVWDGRAWHETVIFLVESKPLTLDVSGQQVACDKIVRRTTIDGVKQPDATEWVARKPLFFDEKLVKLESSGTTSEVKQGRGGKSVFEATPEKKEEPKKDDAPPPPEKKKL
jgi:hypothetical protein